MTKVAPPCSVHDALARIASQLTAEGGWKRVAAIADRALSTVYNWGNPDTPECVPIDIAIKLDIAYQAAGGDGAPFHDVYALLLQTGMEQRFATQVELARRVQLTIKENAEAEAAQLACALPGATDADRDRAIRETQDAIDVQKTTLALLKNGNGPDEASGVAPTGVGK